MQNPFWKSRTFRVWIAGYLAILLIPLAFSFLLYSSTADKLTRKACESNEMALRQAGSVMDEELKSIFSLSDTITVSSDILRLQYVDLPYTAEKYYEVHRRARFLNTFVAHQSLVREFYIYCPKLDSLLDSGHIYTRINQYSHVITDHLGLPEDVFEALMTQHNATRLVLTNGRLLLVHTISYDVGLEKPDLVLIMNLNTDTVLSLIAGLEATQKGEACIILPDQDVFGSWPDSTFLATGALQTSGPDTLDTLLESTVSPLRVRLSVPRTVVLQDVSSTATLFLYFVLWTLGLGGLIAFWLARRNYRPLHRLKQAVNMESQNTDEFSMINHQIEALKLRRQRAEEELLYLSRAENSLILGNLLSGNLKALDSRQLAHVRENLDGSAFVVVYLPLDDFREDGADPEALVPRLEQCYRDCGADALRCIVQPVQSGLAVILCFSEAMDRYEYQLTAKKISNEILSSSPDFSAISAFVGDAHSDTEGIALSLSEALKAREYAEFVSENEKRVLLYDQTMYSSTVSFDDFDIVGAERRLVSMMIEGDDDGCEKLLSEIMGYYTAHDGVSLHVMRMRMFRIMNMMLNTLREVEAYSSSSAGIDETLTEKLTSARTMQELEDSLFSILHTIRDHRSSGDSQLADRLSRVAQYIEAQYADPNLSVQQLADRFDMSLPYLSREFKKEKGVGVLSYINGCRIRKAREILLLNDDITLSALASRVGYNSSQTLIRIFKRYENMTPGQFRLSHGKSAVQ